MNYIFNYLGFNSDNLKKYNSLVNYVKNTYYADINIDVTGGSNTFDIEIAENSNADYLDLDWIIDGDNNEFDFDIDYESATNYIDLLG